MNASEPKDLVVEKATDAVLERLEHLFIGANRVIASDIVDTAMRALRSEQKDSVGRLKAAGCTSADGTFIHASTESVLNALGVNRPEQKDSVSVPREQDCVSGLKRASQIVQDYIDEAESKRPPKEIWNNNREVSPSQFMLACVKNAIDDEVAAPVDAAPGHTDLMVTPESLDAWLEKNPPPEFPSTPAPIAEDVHVDRIEDGDLIIVKDAIAVCRIPAIIENAFPGISLRLASGLTGSAAEMRERCAGAVAREAGFAEAEAEECASVERAVRYSAVAKTLRKLEKEIRSLDPQEKRAMGEVDREKIMEIINNQIRTDHLGIVKNADELANAILSLIGGRGQ